MFLFYKRPRVAFPTSSQSVVFTAATVRGGIIMIIDSCLVDHGFLSSIFAQLLPFSILRALGSIPDAASSINIITSLWGDAKSRGNGVTQSLLKLMWNYHIPSLVRLKFTASNLGQFREDNRLFNHSNLCIFKTGGIRVNCIVHPYCLSTQVMGQIHKPIDDGLVGGPLLVYSQLICDWT